MKRRREEEESTVGNSSKVGRVGDQDHLPAFVCEGNFLDLQTHLVPTLHLHPEVSSWPLEKYHKNQDPDHAIWLHIVQLRFKNKVQLLTGFNSSLNTLLWIQEWIETRDRREWKSAFVQKLLRSIAHSDHFEDMTVLFVVPPEKRNTWKRVLADYTKHESHRTFRFLKRVSSEALIYRSVNLRFRAHMSLNQNLDRNYLELFSDAELLHDTKNQPEDAQKIIQAILKDREQRTQDRARLLSFMVTVDQLQKAKKAEEQTMSVQKKLPSSHSSIYDLGMLAHELSGLLGTPECY